jgi:microcin C transport system permease protein
MGAGDTTGSGGASTGEGVLSGLVSPVLAKRIRKFRRLRRGYWSFVLLVGLYVLSFGCELIVGNTALVVRYRGQSYFPLFSSRFLRARDFDMKGFGPPNYRALAVRLAAEGQGDFVVMPPYAYGPTENLLSELEGRPPHPPGRDHWLGTDDRGRDVLARLVYGFRISLSFGVFVTSIGYGLGIATGAALGYYGGRLDLIGVRLVETWSALPFLYIVMIVSAVLVPSFRLLAAILAAFTWMGVCMYMRGEFYREKSRDYVSAAIATGLPDRAIIFRHILPNALTPVFAFAPFAVLSHIVELVALDFLGFGLPPPTPSWGELLGQGLANLHSRWLVMTPLAAMFSTLLLITFIGEATREAFDPREYSRLR